MGRSNIYPQPPPETKVRLFIVYLDSGGYDEGGAYWGIGDPLYCAYYEVDEELEGRLFIRAKNREEAKKHVRHRYRWPDAKFYR